MALALLIPAALAEEIPDLKDDFYEAVNAEWLAETEIPPDAASVDAFSQMEDKVQETLMADFQAMLSGEKDVPEELTDFIEFYRLAADYETRDALGAEPLLPYLERIEGLESLEEFFFGWARTWRQKMIPAYAAQLLTLDVHAPNKLRANIQLQNMDDFFTTFGIEEGDGMYRAPEDRVSIW